MLRIDLNCDMGEGFGAYRLGRDAELLDYVSSANIACGFHAGDPLTMAESVGRAARHGVALGAHPGYRDLVGFGRRALDTSPAEIAAARQRLAAFGVDAAAMSDDEIQKMSAERARRFREDAPMTAAAAAKVILDGVKAERWRILVGDDAHLLDSWVRDNPESAYEPDFFQRFAQASGWRVGGN